jgi:outer membrane protein assembly factor BamB
MRIKKQNTQDFGGLIIDGKTITTSRWVGEIEKFEEGILLRFIGESKNENKADIAVNYEKSGNIIKLNENGSLCWQIRDPKGIVGQNNISNFNKIMNIFGEVWAHNEDGHLYNINKQTGNLVDYVNNNILPIGNDYIELPGRIVDAQMHRNKIAIVIFPTDEVNEDVNKTNNVHLYNQSGDIIWVIEEPDSSGYDIYNRVKVENDSLNAHTQGGFTYTIDSQTGKIIDSEFTK